MELSEAMNLLRQACEQHSTTWAQHQLMQQALVTVEAATGQDISPNGQLQTVR